MQPRPGGIQAGPVAYGRPPMPPPGQGVSIEWTFIIWDLIFIHDIYNVANATWFPSTTWHASSKLQTTTTWF